MVIAETAEKQQIIDRAYQAGQGDVFRHWDILNNDQKNNLLEQINQIDFSLLKFLINDVYRANKNSKKPRLKPAKVRSLRERKKLDAEATKIGEQQLVKGTVAAVLVAGGQSTRLGYDGPKGTFLITPVKQKSLFQLHAEKIVALCRKYHTTIPWYIMTSKLNYLDTLTFFETNNYFGLHKKNIFFFQQELIPAIDRKGRLILDAPEHIFINPNGHGGVLKALWDSGAISDMKQRGIENIFYFQIDNALTKICDPPFIGYHILNNAEMSNKIVQKKYPKEQLGIICTINGSIGVMEYSDLSRDDMFARNSSGKLKYSAGSIAIHMLTVPFIERLNQDGFKLPYHVAKKIIPCLDKDGKFVTPSHKNGIKFETFIFDALPLAQNTLSLEVIREEEFSPVKNLRGVDSPATTRQDMCNLYGNWLENAGFVIPRNKQGNVKIKLEISPLFALDKEDVLAKRKDIKAITENLYLD